MIKLTGKGGKSFENRKHAVKVVGNTKQILKRNPTNYAYQMNIYIYMFIYIYLYIYVYIYIYIRLTKQFSMSWDTSMYGIEHVNNCIIVTISTPCQNSQVSTRLQPNTHVLISLSPSMKPKSYLSFIIAWHIIPYLRAKKSVGLVLTWFIGNIPGLAWEESYCWFCEVGDFSTTI